MFKYNILFLITITIKLVIVQEAYYPSDWNAFTECHKNCFALYNCQNQYYVYFPTNQCAMDNYINCIIGCQYN